MSAVDLFMAYSFVKKLVTPFSRWKAFELGIIDADGNVLKQRNQLRTTEERLAFGYHDILLLNMKKLLGKIPGGRTVLASYAAAMLLLREEVETEEQMEALLESLEERLTESISLMEDAPANAVGGGDIAGAGVGPKGEPGVHPKASKRYKKKSNEEEPSDDKKEVVAKVRRVLGRAV